MIRSGICQSFLSKSSRSTTLSCESSSKQTKPFRLKPHRLAAGERIDDEIVTTQVLEEQLDRALLSIDQIYVAYNTSMARDILQKNKVELILCDIEMPKENGIHFLEWVREQKIQTEVIFLTSHEKFEYAYGAVQNGAANYLLKPIDMNKINQTLLRVTEKIVWKQKTEEIREYWESGIRKMSPHEEKHSHFKF